MKYIIKESQLNLLMESKFHLYVRRRAIPEVMRKYVLEVVAENSIDCEEHSYDEYNFADSIIEDAVENFFADLNDDEYIDHHDFDTIVEDVRTKFRDEFGDGLMNLFKDNCED